MARFGAAEYKEAVSDFLRALELDPQNPKASHYLGVLYRVMEQPEQAIEAFQKSLEINPYHFDTLLALSQTLCGTGDYPAALESCEKALALEPEDARAGDHRKRLIRKMKI
jgi:tetratricopeptide (TPR) repeat protein